MTNVQTNEVREKGALGKRASFILNGKTTQEKNEALAKIADQLVKDQAAIIEENKKDLISGEEKGLPKSTLDRIMLDENRIADIAEAVRLLIKLEDPIGETLESIEKENGLRIIKKRVPLGVVGMIYEARPNVTVDAATLCLKTGNAVILRGSSSARYSNIALVKSIQTALAETSLPVDSVQLIEDTSRETAKELFDMKEYLDVLIPRGGKNLIDLVVREATVPVLETGAGNCHLYIDETADYEMAEKVAINAKTQRPSVCNAIEGLVIHKDWVKENGAKLLNALKSHGVEIHADEASRSVFPEAIAATEDDWGTEYLDMELSVKTVLNAEEAIEHINKYGTKHSEGIITNNQENAEKFMSGIDATTVYHNASTRFTDGSEFGYGAEIGISTQKLHARGPMGLPALTSTKYYVFGAGQIR